MKANIGIPINIPKLIETRALVQANSGGGKSYLLRKLLEETHGKVQQIILDIEGEFSSLREKYDYVVFGEGGDYPLSIKYADQIAKSLMELSVSAIIDLSELEHHQRIIFVERFLNRLINLPKNLWKPCLVVIDEAHQFCPQSGNVSSAKAVIDLCTRGRKRGYAAILATQRISKLHKDAAAETLNKFIGRTGLDVDMKRAAEELGMTTKTDMLSLRALGEGDFFAFGPAISNEVTRFHVNPVITNHPRSGSRIIEVPKPSDKIKELLGKLKDLPEEAEREVKTVESLKKENALLKTKLTHITKNGVESGKVEEYKTEILDLKKRIQYLQFQIKGSGDVHGRVKSWLGSLLNGANQLKDSIEIWESQVKEQTSALSENGKPIGILETISRHKIIQTRPEPKTQMPTVKPNSQKVLSDGSLQLGKCAYEIVKFLAVRPDKSFSKAQIGAMTGYSPNGGSFNNSISELNTKRLIEKSGSNLKLSEGGVEYLNFHNINPGEGEFSPRIWLDKLPLASKKIYEVLLENPQHEFSKQELGELTQYEPNGGSFNNSISKLCVLGLAERVNGMIRLNHELVEEGY